MPAKCHQGELKSKPSTVVSHLWHMWRLRSSAGVSPPDAAYRQGAQCSERESCRGDTKGSARNHGSRRYFHANKRHFWDAFWWKLIRVQHWCLSCSSEMFIFFFRASDYWFTAPVTSLCAVWESQWVPDLQSQACCLFAATCWLCMQHAYQEFGKFRSGAILEKVRV